MLPYAITQEKRRILEVCYFAIGLITVDETLFCKKRSFNKTLNNLMSRKIKQWQGFVSLSLSKIVCSVIFFIFAGKFHHQMKFWFHMIPLRWILSRK